MGRNVSRNNLTAGYVTCRQRTTKVRSACFFWGINAWGGRARGKFFFRAELPAGERPPGGELFSKPSIFQFRDCRSLVVHYGDIQDIKKVPKP